MQTDRVERIRLGLLMEGDRIEEDKSLELEVAVASRRDEMGVHALEGTRHATACCTAGGYAEHQHMAGAKARADRETEDRTTALGEVE